MKFIIPLLLSAAILALFCAALFLIAAIGSHHGDVVASAMVEDDDEEIPERVTCIPCNGEGYICGKQCRNCNGYGTVKTHAAELQMYPDDEPDCQVKILSLLKK